MHKCAVVKREEEAKNPKKKKMKGFINFAEIGGICNMHHRPT